MFVGECNLQPQHIGVELEGAEAQQSMLTLQLWSVHSQLVLLEVIGTKRS